MKQLDIQLREDKRYDLGWNENGEWTFICVTKGGEQLRRIVARQLPSDPSWLNMTNEVRALMDG